MSAVALAPSALKRRTLERTGMTPEQELELLIREQQADDTFFIDRRHGEISLDAPIHGGGTVGTELVGYDPWDEVDMLLDLGEDPTTARGHVVSYVRSSPGDVLVDPRKLQHGLVGTYRTHGCRCSYCRAANTAQAATYRARRKAESGGSR